MNENQGFKWRDVPTVSKLFLLLGVAFRIICLILANIGQAVGAQLIFIIVIGLPFLLWTCFHWLPYVILSRWFRQPMLAAGVGVLMLTADAYISIHAIFKPAGSTSAIALVFIPLYVGVPGLILYAIGGFLGKRRGVS